MSLRGRDMSRPGQVLDVPLLQQGQVAVRNQRRNLHAAAAMFQLRLVLSADAAMRIIGRIGCLPAIDLAEFMLLGRDLDEQALAQIPGPHTRGVKMLHQVDAAAQQLGCGCLFRLPLLSLHALGNLPEVLPRWRPGIRPRSDCR